MKNFNTKKRTRISIPKKNNKRACIKPTEVPEINHDEIDALLSTVDETDVNTGFDTIPAPTSALLHSNFDVNMDMPVYTTQLTSASTSDVLTSSSGLSQVEKRQGESDVNSNFRTVLASTSALLHSNFDLNIGMPLDTTQLTPVSTSEQTQLEKEHDEVVQKQLFNPLPYLNDPNNASTSALSMLSFPSFTEMMTKDKNNNAVLDLLMEIRTTQLEIVGLLRAQHNAFNYTPFNFKLKTKDDFEIFDKMLELDENKTRFVSSIFFNITPTESKQCSPMGPLSPLNIFTLKMGTPSR